ncbi:hypothetical protein BC826DRAFT_967032 [Russula brevipes]|nr:hypothetical protein BC826DRAFT_967032 [Russula brevipes]
MDRSRTSLAQSVSFTVGRIVERDLSPRSNEFVGDAIGTRVPGALLRQFQKRSRRDGLYSSLEVTGPQCRHPAKVPNFFPVAVDGEEANICTRAKGTKVLDKKFPQSRGTILVDKLAYSAHIHIAVSNAQARYSGLYAGAFEKHLLLSSGSTTSEQSIRGQKVLTRLTTGVFAYNSARNCPLVWVVFFPPACDILTAANSAHGKSSASTPLPMLRLVHSNTSN